MQPTHDAGHRPAACGLSAAYGRGRHFHGNARQMDAAGRASLMTRCSNNATATGLNSPDVDRSSPSRARRCIAWRLGRFTDRKLLKCSGRDG
jgi:hypothetical protein